MPVERVSGKTTLLAAIARLCANLFTHHVTQHHQALFGPAIFGFKQVEIHQTMEHPHGGMTLQLTTDVVLGRL